MRRFRSPASRIELRRGGFTLIELLTACAVLALLTVILVMMADQGGRLWAMTESKNQYRQRARALLQFMAAELGQAVIPLEGSQTSLQLVINPPGAAAFPWHDTIFWQAPIATETSSGDLAQIGYFVRWTENQPNLCRFFVNPSDPNYLIHAQPADWIAGTLLDTVAPGDRGGEFRGLYLENVLGMWINAFYADGTACPNSSDSRFNTRESGRLPAYIEISLVLINSATAKRITITDAGTLQAVCQASASAQVFATDSALPDYVRNNCTILTTTVNLANAK